jgi:RNA polymerase sigma factor (sigma-70 family)
MEDWRLIRRYVETQSRAAFAEIVERHLKLVYNTCLRDLRDPQMAEDATQVVFLVLAQKAAGFTEDIALPGWLFRTARFAARAAIRANIREARRTERVGEAMLLTVAEEGHAWGRIDGVLNDALASLPAIDREVVLLHYFEGMSFAEIGGVLKTSENAANKRTIRAVDKLRRYLTSRHVAVTVASLGALLTAHSVEAAPVASWLPLSQAITGGAAAGVHLAGMNITVLTQGVIRQMLIAKLKTAVLIGGVIAVGLGVTALTTHVRAIPHATPDVAAAGKSTEATPPIKIVAGSPEDKLLTHLAKYPLEIKSLSAHIQRHYSFRPAPRFLRADSSIPIPSVPPSPDEEADWAFSGNKRYSSLVVSSELDGSPVRENIYSNGPEWDITEFPKTSGHPASRQVKFYGASSSRTSWPEAWGPLTYGYFDGQDWLSKSLGKTGFEVIGSENDPKFGPLTVIKYQLNDPHNPSTIQLWLSDNHGFACVKRDQTYAKGHIHWEATELEKIGSFWVPIRDTFLHEHDFGSGLTLDREYTEQFTDIHINNVPDSIFQHYPLPAGTTVWAYDSTANGLVPQTLDAAGNLRP